MLVDLSKFKVCTMMDQVPMHHPNFANTYAYGRMAWMDCGCHGRIPTWGIQRL
jgi:hypothetical protein